MIVVDQTSPVIKRNGLYCVKVLIPGLIPMTFGQRFIRLEGLERISPCRRSSALRKSR
ncbi:hypothetical protein PO124_31150 [Bacillus licheniformis]|nr:hypothetical protein [Bacillus licheniformis]